MPILDNAEVAKLTEKDSNNRVYPIPEIFPEEKGRGWKIKHNNTVGVDFSDRTIYAPLNNDAVSHCLQMQQIGCIKWGHNGEVGDLKNSLLYRSIESSRISHLLNKAGIDLSAGFLSKEDSDMAVLQVAAGAEEAMVLGALLLFDYTDLGRTISSLGIPGRISSIYQEVHRRIETDPTAENAINIAKWVKTQVTDINTEELSKDKKHAAFRGQPGKGKPDGKNEGADFDDYYEDAWDQLDEDNKLQDIPAAIREMLPKDLPEAMKMALAQQLASQCSLVPWGEMSLEEPARNRNVLGKFQRKWKVAEEGVLPRYHHRFYTDKKVFARRTKLPGGTVVIDCSGSMGFSHQDVETIVEHAPGCVVACYSGNGTQGVLRILAKDGSRVADEYCGSPFGNGNIVDFPALKWAYRQNHPRIWVTDYGVTGVQDCPGSANLVMCAAAVKKGKFYVAHRVHDAVKLLKHLGRYYRK